ncbi:MAG: TonB-dependent receptor [Bacteroidales bacterium]
MKCKNLLSKPIWLLLLIFFAPMLMFAQNMPVKGVVKDDSGKPVIGVSIIEKGTMNGVMTDNNGYYTINVSKNATLVFSFIGFKAQELVVKDETTLNVILHEDSTLLNEVVVVGYGTARKSDVTGSIASVDQKTLGAMPVQSFSEALQGRIAGVEINTTSSRPGANQQIRIRGTRSLNASNDPLIVLDGIPYPGSISDINPNEIKSLDILKDASSTAIYGSRGANGVILISTNRGKKGKATVSYNGYYGINTLFSEYPMMNTEQFKNMRELATANGSSWGAASPDDDYAIDTNWQDKVFQNAFTTNHDLTITAGTDKGSYSLGGTYFNESALVPNQGYKRMSIRTAIDQEIGDYIKIGLTSQNIYSRTTGETSVPNYLILEMNPSISPYDENGDERTDDIQLNSSDIVTNPLLLDNAGDKHKELRQTYATYNSFYAEIKLLDCLKYRFNVGLNYRQSNYGKFNAPGTPYMSYNATLSEASISNSQNYNWTIENLLTFDKTYGKHKINAVAMFSKEQTTYQSSSASATGISADEIQYYNLGLNTDKMDINPSNQPYWQRGLMSYMARVSYSYSNKYMASATVRSDGSSVLADGKQWHTYPALSVGWNMKNEDFMRDYDWLSLLKLRVGVGQTSNQSIAPYATLGSMSPVYYTFGDVGATGYFPSSVPNENLGWEYSTTWNYGVDFALFNDRLSGTFEYYTQKTKDILMQLNLPSTSGIYSSFWQNIGETENKGLELSLNGTIIDNHNGWSWDVGFNVYANRNKIVSLAGDQGRDISNGWFVGQPIDAIYDYKKIGIYQLGEEDKAAAAIAGGKPGDIKIAYNTVDGDPVSFDADGVPSRQINSSDRQVVGTAEGDFAGGFNTRVSYKNLDLNIVGSFKSGGTLISTLHSSQGYLNMLSGRRGNVDVNYWTEDNPTNDYPTPGGTGGSGDAPIFASTLAYFDASYVKIRTMTLGYTFTKNILDKVGLNQARVYFTVQNPFVLFSPYNDETGLDPEPNSYVRENSATEGSLPSRFLSIGINTPSTRKFILGVNISF